MGRACIPHYRTRRHTFTRHVFVRPEVGSSFDTIPRWYQPPRLPKFHDNTRFASSTFVMRVGEWVGQMALAAS